MLRSRAWAAVQEKEPWATWCFLLVYAGWRVSPGAGCSPGCCSCDSLQAKGMSAGSGGSELEYTPWHKGNMVLAKAAIQCYRKLQRCVDQPQPQEGS
jgi:hypothetical protein